MRSYPLACIIEEQQKVQGKVACMKNVCQNDKHAQTRNAPRLKVLGKEHAVKIVFLQ